MTPFMGSKRRRRNCQCQLLPHLGRRLNHQRRLPTPSCSGAQRARDAFLAMSDRFSAVSFSARAFPPFSPPLRPSVTAAGSLTVTTLPTSRSIPARAFALSGSSHDSNGNSGHNPTHSLSSSDHSTL